MVAAMSAPAAFADKPNGTFVYKDNAKSQGNCNGVLSSRIIQNGQFVSGNGAIDPAWDQTTYPGSRADIVHAQANSC
jgi:hypothetical protein